MNPDCTRPWTVELGCAVSLAISIWDAASAVFDKDLIESIELLAFVLAFSAIPLIFTLAAFLRRNWGRIVLAVMNALGVLTVPILLVLGDEAAATDGSLVESALYTIAEVIVIVLLFMPASNEWYRKPRAATA